MNVEANKGQLLQFELDSSVRPVKVSLSSERQIQKKQKKTKKTKNEKIFSLLSRHDEFD